MIKINAIWLFSIISFAAVAIALFLILFFKTKIRGEKFSFLRNFPYEFEKMYPKAINAFKPLMFALTALAFSPIFFITPLKSDFGDVWFFVIFVTCVFGLSAITNCLLFFFDASFNKTHIILATIAMCLTFLANVLTVIVSLIVYKENVNRALSLTCMIAGIILACVMLVVIFNPNLKNWVKLKKVEANGSISYERGKIFVLALSEWITILVSILGEIVFIISMIK